VDRGRVLIRSKPFIASELGGGVTATPWRGWNLEELAGRSNKLGGSTSRTPREFEHCLLVFFVKISTSTSSSFPQPASTSKMPRLCVFFVSHQSPGGRADDVTFALTVWWNWNGSVYTKCQLRIRAKLAKCCTGTRQKCPQMSAAYYRFAGWQRKPNEELRWLSWLAYSVKVVHDRASSLKSCCR